MKKIFIDCSYIVEHVELNTGIQRVVRRVVETLSEIAPAHNVEIILVSIVNGEFQPLNLWQLYPAEVEDAVASVKLGVLGKAKQYVRDVYVSGRDFVDALCGHQRTIHQFLYAPRTQFGLSSFVYTPVNWIKRGIVKLDINKKQQEQLTMFDAVSEGDTLLLLDSTWYADIWPSVELVRSRGASIVSIIYDLIPITHPQFCDDFLVEVFKDYFKTSTKYVDKYIAISNTVQKDLEIFMLENFGESAKRKNYDCFLLGSDFETREKTQMARADLARCFQSNSTYLIVSTVEPRKNHQYLLDAFDVLWGKGLKVSLCIIGRVGWKVEGLIERIESHPQYNSQLFHFTNVDDDELSFCYQNAKMLVFPSIIEGFGLPIVESLNYGLPVLASKTPVHQEVGGDHIGYFDLDFAESLANDIARIELDGMPEEYRVPDNYKWMSWEESSTMLLSKMQ